MSGADPFPSHAPQDSGLADAAAEAVAAFVSEWAARGLPPDRALDAVSAAVVQVRQTNRGPVRGDDLAERVRTVIESGGLPPPEPDEDILGGTDLDGLGGV